MQDVIKKLKFKDKGIILNAPAAIEKEFIKAGFITKLEKTNNKNSLVFINDEKGFVKFLKTDLKKIEVDSVLWFAYPKGTSKIKTDINRDIIRMTGEEYGITTVAAISIDETWSGIRFRPIDCVGK